MRAAGKRGRGRAEGGQAPPCRHGDGRGFTLVEALTVVAVLSVLATIALPSFDFLLGRSASLAAETEFVAALNYARSEALRRGLPVALTATAPVVANGFGGGWTVWVDSNGNGAYDHDEPVIRRRDAFPANLSLGDGSANQVYFTGQGFLSGGAALQFKACSSAASGNTGYRVTVLPGGVVDVLEQVSCP